MTSADLIGAVAANHLADMMEREPTGTLRFCIMGLGPELTSSIAKAAADHPALSGLSIRIPETLAMADLPFALTTMDSVVRYRHDPPPDGKRAVLFGIDSEQLKTVGKTMECVTRIDASTIRGDSGLWIDASGLSVLGEAERNALQAALEGLDRSGTARTLEVFADFVRRVAEQINSGTTSSVADACDRALPALHLPARSGGFAKRRSGMTASDWSKQFKAVETAMRPLLRKETAKGDPLDVSAALKRLQKAITEKAIDTREAGALQDFLLDTSVGADGWRPSQAALCETEWPLVADVLQGNDKREPKSLGAETEKFFEDEFPGLLDQETLGLLKTVRGGRRQVPEEVVEFFLSHRTEIGQNRSLSVKWEKLIFSTPDTYGDFLEGLVGAIHRLVERTDAIPDDPVIVVDLQGAEKKSFWESRSADLVALFKLRCRGLREAFGEAVEFRFGRVFTHPEDDVGKPETSTKTSWEFKFELCLLPRAAMNDKAVRKAAPVTQFIWTVPPQSVALALVKDLEDIASGQIVRLSGARIARESISAKGEIQRIRLEDATTLRDALEGSGGRLFRHGAPLSDLGTQFREALEQLDGPVLQPEQADQVRQAFDAFEAAYQTAIREWIDPAGEGPHGAAFLEQAEAYGHLLRTLRRDAARDECVERLWKPALSIGVATITTGGRAAVVAPWHPLRMAEQAAKLCQAAAVARRVVHADIEDVAGAEIFFRQTCQTLSSTYWPEVCIDGADGKPGLLAATSAHLGYTLMEPPMRRTGAGPADEDEVNEALDTEAAAAAGAFAAIAEEYLDLFPHERANFSVVLYNAESKDLPMVLADKLSSKVERDSDLRCDLMLSHDDPARTRRIYEQQNAAAAEDTASSLSSEAARTFMSRLRVGFADADSFTNDDGSRAADLVLLQDVVARSAALRWIPAHFADDRPPQFTHSQPPLWSRRRPTPRGDLRAVSALVAPLQPEPAQAWLDLLHDMVEEKDLRQDSRLPAREVNFNDGDIGRVLDKAHKMGDWVVSYDALADRRLLEARDIRIIRHVNNRDAGRNLVISTKEPSDLLLSMLKERLAAIMTGTPEDRRNVIADCLYERALRLSGRIIMRAARHGRHAGELMGLVLSMAEAKAALGDAGATAGWFFLDDYATWLGRRDGQVADILALAPLIENGRPTLRLLVTESKFVGTANHLKAAKESATQLYETVERLGRALNPERDRIDRPLWLHRIGDLMIEGMEPFPDGTLGSMTLEAWSRAVREGRIPIEILGLSHVFVHDDETVGTEEEFLPRHRHLRQRTFGRNEVRYMLDALDGPAPATAPPEWRDVLTWAPDDAVRQPPEEIVEKSEPEQPAPPQVGIEDGVEIAPDVPPPVTPAAMPSGGAAYPARVLAWLSACTDEADAPEDLAWLEETVQRLRSALFGYGMTSKVLGSRLTPNAALIRLKGSNELTVQKVEKRQGELLTTHAISVIAVLEAPGEVVVMVARPKRAVLALPALWRLRELPATAPQSCLSPVLGAREADGEVLYLNLGEAFGGQEQHGPHTLIAGETGSGKGILVQNLLLDICATNSPKLARIKMIDPKAGVDYTWLKRMPHLDGGLLTTQEQAVAALEGLVDEMERRYRLFAEADANKISRYNAKVPPQDRLPVILVFHDELADWMLMDDYRNAVSTSVNRLGVAARAAGIHLVFVTQRPDKDALPMQLRANLTNRLVLKVSDKRNSELVLDETGAEKLLGRGHLAAKLSGEGGIILAQVPFLDEDSAFALADAIVRSWEEQPEPVS